MGIRRLWALGALGLTPTLLAGCGSAPATHKPVSLAKFTLVGQVRVVDTCSAMAADGYSDITPGAQVAVTGPTGKTLGVGPLMTPMQVDAGGESQCEFTFTVSGLPRGLSEYGITVSHRGTLDYTWAQVQQPVIMTLGAG
jgi:hypothetical protein